MVAIVMGIILIPMGFLDYNAFSLWGFTNIDVFAAYYSVHKIVYIFY